MNIFLLGIWWRNSNVWSLITLLVKIFLPLGLLNLFRLKVWESRNRLPLWRLRLLNAPLRLLALLVRPVFGQNLTQAGGPRLTLGPNNWWVSWMRQALPMLPFAVFHRLIAAKFGPLPKLMTFVASLLWFVLMFLWVLIWIRMAKSNGAEWLVPGGKDFPFILWGMNCPSGLLNLILLRLKMFLNPSNLKPFGSFSVRIYDFVWVVYHVEKTHWFGSETVASWNFFQVLRLAS